MQEVLLPIFLSPRASPLALCGGVEARGFYALRPAGFHGYIFSQSKTPSCPKYSILEW